jgi:CreA protein
MRFRVSTKVLLVCAALAGLLVPAAPALAERIGAINTATVCLAFCNKIVLDSVKDEHVPGVACWISRAVTGSMNPLSDDPSDASISCRQVGPISADLKALKARDGEQVFAQRTSLIWKSLTAYRYVDLENKTIIYMLISGKLTDGSPKNSNSPVPVMPWSEKN